VYTWKVTPGAVYYHVSFVRNGKQFYDTQTADPWIRVPDSMKFPPGIYRWSVRPAVVGDTGIVVGEAVLVRTFRVGRG
jgi:hypothetical protein